MSKKTLLLLVFSIDIWASLCILQRQQRRRQPADSWEVPVAIAGENRPRPATLLSPVLVWVRDGQCGLWPDQKPLTVEELCRLLSAQSRDENVRPEVRLLCDPRLTLQQWGPVAVQLSRVAEEISVAPLVDEPGTDTRRDRNHRVAP